MKLCSVADLKVYLEKPDNQQDTLLGMIIDQVSQRIETALNRKLTKVARTEKFNGGRRLYYVAAYPIDEALALTVVVEGVSKVKDTDFFVEPTSGLIEFWLETVFTKPRGVVITYTGGFATDTPTQLVSAPDDLKRAALLQAAFDFRRRKDIGLSSVTMPDGSVAVESPASLLPEVKSILKAYRKQVMIQ